MELTCKVKKNILKIQDIRLKITIIQIKYELMVTLFEPYGLKN